MEIVDEVHAHDIYAYTPTLYSEHVLGHFFWADLVGSDFMHAAFLQPPLPSFYVHLFQPHIQTAIAIQIYSLR